MKIEFFFDLRSLQLFIEVQERTLSLDLIQKFRMLINKYHLTMDKDGSKFKTKISLKEFLEGQIEEFLEDFSRITYKASEPIELSVSFTKSKFDSTFFNVIEKWNMENAHKIKIYEKNQKYKLRSEDQTLLFGLVLSLLQFIYEELL
jgi:hypothetical protein